MRAIQTFYASKCFIQIIVILINHPYCTSDHHVQGPGSLPCGYHILLQMFLVQSENRIGLRQSKGVNCQCFQIACTKSEFGQYFLGDFFKSVFLGFSNRNTSLEFSKKKLSCYAVWHCRQPIQSPPSPTLLRPTSLPLSQHPKASPSSTHHTASHHRSPRPTSASVKPSHELAPRDSVGLG